MFNMDSNEAWQMRRSFFRNGFSIIQLKKRDEFVKNLCLKVCNVLDTAAERREVVEIDKLFGQLTVDVICEVAFQLDIGALEDSEEFHVCPLFV